MIKRKKKICSGCHKEKYLWQSTPPKCQSCANKSKGKIEKPNVKKIAQFSDKMLNQLAAYRRLRNKYLDEHPYCEAKLPVCTNKNFQLHHTRGRHQYLNDITTFKSVCPECHRHIHEFLSMEEAVKLGLMMYRN